MTQEPYLHFIGDHSTAGGEFEDYRRLLGAKGAKLSELSRRGLPIPAGFVLTANVSAFLGGNKRQHPPLLEVQVERALDRLERCVGKRFGDNTNPLLVSIRISARHSTVGLSEPILNLGLNDHVAEAIAALSGDRRFALDCYRRFIRAYSTGVLKISHDQFEHILDDVLESRDLYFDSELDANSLAEVIGRYKQVVKKITGAVFPQDANRQLWGAIDSAFDSWTSDRAGTYRRLNDIDDTCDMAVVVQAMVFGNLGEKSAAGLAFSRDPSTGAKQLVGEYLMNAQGSEASDGIRMPAPVSNFWKAKTEAEEPSLEDAMPAVFQELCEMARRLEEHGRDMQDFEFTVEQGQLYLLGSKPAKRTSEAAIRVAVDMLGEGLVNETGVLQLVSPSHMAGLARSRLNLAKDVSPVAKGLGASPGAAVGAPVFTAQDAVAARKRGEDSILVVVDVSPDDIEGIHAAAGLLAIRGGMTSHAAVVARGMGRPCVCGVGVFEIDAGAACARLPDGRAAIVAGKAIALDGDKGLVFAEGFSIQPAVLSNAATQIVELARKQAMVEVGEIVRPSHNQNRIGELKVGAGFIGIDFGDIAEVEGVGVWGLIGSSPQARRKPIYDNIGQALAEEMSAALRATDIGELTINVDWSLPIDRLRRVAPNDLSLDELISATSAIECSFGLGHVVTSPAIARLQVDAFRTAVAETMSQWPERRYRLAVSNCVSPRDLPTVRRWLQHADEGGAPGILERVALGAMVQAPGPALIAGELFLDADFVIFDLARLQQCLLPLDGNALGEIRGVVTLGDRSASIFDVSGVERLFSASRASMQRRCPRTSLEVIPSATLEPDDVQSILRMQPERLFVANAELPGWLVAAARHSLSQGK